MSRRAVPGEPAPWRALAVGACVWLVSYGLRHLLAGGDVIAGITQGNLLWGAGLVSLLCTRVFLVLVWPVWVIYRGLCYAAWRMRPHPENPERK